VYRVVQQKWCKGPGKMKITSKYTKQRMARVSTGLQWINNGSCGQISEDHIPSIWCCWAVWCPCTGCAGTDLELPVLGPQRGKLQPTFKRGGENQLCMKCGPAVVQVTLGFPGSLDAGIQEWPSPLYTDTVHLSPSFVLVLFPPLLLQSSPMPQPPVRYAPLVLAVLFLSGCPTPWVRGSLSKCHQELSASCCLFRGCVSQCEK